MIDIAMTTRFEVTFDGDMSDLAAWIQALRQADKMLPTGLTQNLQAILNALQGAYAEAANATRRVNYIEIDEDNDG